MPLEAMNLKHSGCLNTRYDVYSIPADTDYNEYPIPADTDYNESWDLAHKTIVVISAMQTISHKH